MSSTASQTAPSRTRSFWDRELLSYPTTGARARYLAIVVLVTVTVYYELYIQAGVGPIIIKDFGFTFSQFVLVSIIGNLFGAFAALAAGLADRWGRVNLVLVGLLVGGLLVLFALPNASSKTEYTVYFALLTVVEGMNLVATPALIRDFSPQVGRGLAMGFWTLGPVLGSLVVAVIASNTLASHPDWRFQFRVAGVVGLVVFVVALLGLRELSPRLRDQIMVSMQDRELVESRTAATEPDTRGHLRQLLRLDIVGSAVAISVFLATYFIFVGFLVVYFATVFGYSSTKANGLANWYWATFAVAVLAGGALSDRLGVRKPVMVGGAVISLIGGGLFAATTTNTGTSYGTFQLYLMLNAAGTAITFAAWMAGFTETVEKRNPAATATGLAVWGWTLRILVVVVFSLLTLIVPATTTLVEKGAQVGAIVAKYPQQVQVLQTVDPPTLAALKANPADGSAHTRAVSELSGLPTADVTKVAALGQAQGQGTLNPADLAFLQANTAKVDRAGAQLDSLAAVPAADLAYLSANAPQVAKAAKDNPGQWQTWWWLCFVGQLLFIPCVFLLTGRWSPRKAREDLLEHERQTDRELAQLHAGGLAAP